MRSVLVSVIVLGGCGARSVAPTVAAEPTASVPTPAPLPAPTTKPGAVASEPAVAAPESRGTPTPEPARETRQATEPPRLVRPRPGQSARQGAPPLVLKTAEKPPPALPADEEGWAGTARDPLAEADRIDATTRKLTSVSATYEVRLDRPDGSIGSGKGDMTILSPAKYRVEFHRLLTVNPFLRQDLIVADGTRFGRRAEGVFKIAGPVATRSTPEVGNAAAAMPRAFAAIMLAPLGTRERGVGAWVRAERARGGRVTVGERPTARGGTRRLGRIRAVSPDGAVSEVRYIPERAIPLSYVRVSAKDGRTLYTIRWDVTPGRTFPRVKFTL